MLIVFIVMIVIILIIVVIVLAILGVVIIHIFTENESPLLSYDTLTKQTLTSIHFIFRSVKVTTRYDNDLLCKNAINCNRA